METEGPSMHYTNIALKKVSKYIVFYGTQFERRNNRLDLTLMKSFCESQKTSFLENLVCCKRVECLISAGGWGWGQSHNS